MRLTTGTKPLMSVQMFSLGKVKLPFKIHCFLRYILKILLLYFDTVKGKTLQLRKYYEARSGFFSGTVKEEQQTVCGCLFQVMNIVQSYCSLRHVMLVFITSGSIYQRLFTCPDVKKNCDSQHSIALQYSSPVRSTSVSTRTATTSGLYAKCNVSGYKQKSCGTELISICFTDPLFFLKCSYTC